MRKEPAEAWAFFKKKNTPNYSEKKTNFQATNLMERLDFKCIYDKNGALIRKLRWLYSEIFINELLTIELLNCN
jgi:ABC-type nitrate/sulfonate/bicarbonate transport system substrate-binding protein